MSRRLLPVLLSGLLAFSAAAAEGEGVTKVPKNAPGTNVEMPAIISPMNDTNGTLAGYAYITCTIIASSPDVAVAIRAKTPFLQDAFVRDVNAKPVALAADPGQVDREGVARRFLADARRIMGAGKVVSVTITKVQMATLRGGPPSNVPLERLPLAETPPQTPESPPQVGKTGS